ncbi:MAG: UDP-N-acetylmuramoyl-tripeptide--D-alanyl-D-alanine ligase [Candidatus Firestonebacteria bacterium]
MEKILIKEIVAWTKGKLLKGSPLDQVHSLSIDTRTLKPGALFLAIKGDNYDGHGFVQNLGKLSAFGALVSKKTEGLDALQAGIFVENTTQALKQIAAGYLSKFTGLKVAGITGSNGKTTTKDILWNILSLSVKTHKPKGSFNNEIGIPLTILGVDFSYKALILEYGMNHPGEIAKLVEMVKPDVAAITNVGTAHIGFFNSRENILKEKWALLENIKPGGIAVINLDDPLIAGKKSLLKEKMLTFSALAAADISAENVTEIKECGTVFTLNVGGKKEKVKLNLLGLHNVSNALCAAALSTAFAVDIKNIARGLEEFISVSAHRLSALVVNGIKILDDAYNANPDSVRRGIKALLNFSAKKRVLVLGEMAELGEFAEKLHGEMGSEAAKNNINALVVTGRTGEWYKNGAIKAGMKKENIYLFADNISAGDFLKGFLEEGDAVLIKGSRRAGMEKIVEIVRSK